MHLQVNYLDKLPLFITGWFLLWVILFEFILPVNNILPRPSGMLESLPDLWNNYNLFFNFISTIVVIYISITAAFIAVRILMRALLTGKGFLFNFLLSIEWFSEYVPGIIIGIILIFWFPGSEYIEFVFAFAVAFTSMSLRLVRLWNSVDKNYTDAALTLGMRKKDISLVEFNSLMPRFSAGIIELHLYLWSMLLIFEFIKGGLGLGFMMRQAFEFRDLSAFFAASLIIGVTVYAGTILLKYLNNKFLFWD